MEKGRDGAERPERCWCLTILSFELGVWPREGRRVADRQLESNRIRFRVMRVTATALRRLMGWEVGGKG